MTNYDNLKSLEVSGKTAIYTLDQIQGGPRLTIAPATADNKSYFNEVLKRSKAQSGKGRVNAEVVENNRNEDRVLYAAHIVKGWAGVKDAQGQDVTYSKEEALQFLKALPDWIFDAIRQFATDPTSFVEYVENEDTIKNS